MPIVAAIISAVIYDRFDLTNSADWSNAASVVLGVAMIPDILGVPLRADLEARAV